MPEKKTAIPLGFVPYVSTSPFIAHLGTLYQREDDNGTAVIGLYVGNGHVNLHRMAHGGMLSALIDNALGYNVARARKHGVVTAHLSIDYLRAVQHGDWLEAHVTLRKLDGRLCFADCNLMVDGQVVVRASGILPVIKAPA